MNEWQGLALDAAEAAGCFMLCPNHSHVQLDLQLNGDRLAERQTAAWEALCAAAQQRGFTGNPDLELQPALMFVLQLVDETCPECGFEAPLPEKPEDRRESHPWA